MPDKYKSDTVINAMNGIILTTLNARYIHTAFGLRYLYANMGELQTSTKLLEFGLGVRAADICEKLLEHQPKIIGFGIYIWNVLEITAIVQTLKKVAPEIIIIAGGPELSHPPDLPDVAVLADYIITGHAETSFPVLCRQLLAGESAGEKIISGRSADLASLVSPYPFYTDIDLRQRVVYVEASRGCPFKCEFCLSALDTTAKPFALDNFLRDMDVLFQRGARNFKFIDRTFNLKIDSSIAILEFFLARLNDELNLHFEVIPDNLPERLKQVIARFPEGVLQFEIGVQSFDSDIQQLISRKQDNEKTMANLKWLREYSCTHIHADLIVGLPGDTLEGFGKSFDKLIALMPQEIQVGILKRLRGAPINRHTENYKMCYDQNPPYAILSTRDISFTDIQRLNRFARYWDLIGNSGRFVQTLPLILSDQPFARFLQFTDALFLLVDSTWKIGLKRLFELTYIVMTENMLIPATTASAVLAADYQRSGEKARPDFLPSQNIELSKRPVANKRQRQLL